MAAKTKNPRKPTTTKQQENPPEKPASWSLVKTLFLSKPNQETPILEQPTIKKPKKLILEQPTSKKPKKMNLEEHTTKKPKKMNVEEPTNKKPKKMKCSGSLCNNTKVMHRPEPSSSSTSPPQKEARKMNRSISKSEFIQGPIVSNNNNNSSVSSSSNSLNSSSFSSTNYSSNSSVSGSFRGMPFRKLSGCYECRMVVDPVLGFTRDSSLRATFCSCSQCGEIFMKPENLELHQAVRHAVSELGPEDTSKNIVEIIFQSSWLRKNSSVCKIDRILKIQNTPKTISTFEEYRESIKTKATKFPKKQPRCIADGNELLRFHCTTLTCPLGLNGSANLCNSISNCKICGIIKNGFRNAGGKGILTTATSGKAHDSAEVAPEIERRAMLVCRVIAGRVKKSPEGSSEDYDSVAGAAGVYANFEELYVFNPKAILPCFVVIYGGF
ncbi:hypothetical protein LguiB_017919 [Lonicera macranthoides]